MAKTTKTESDSAAPPITEYIEPELAMLQQVKSAEIRKLMALIGSENVLALKAYGYDVVIKRLFLLDNYNLIVIKETE